MIQLPPDPVPSAAECNRDCPRLTTDRDALDGQFATGSSDLAALLADRPNLFADGAVFVSPDDVAAMARLVAAVERVVALAPYREAMLAGAPAIARHRPAALGVFLSYDFHLSAAGPRLIEINTNAGGALLSAAVARAQAPFCCSARPVPGLAGLEDRLLAMFAREWRLSRGDAPLRTVAIVDDSPERQFLYPEFLMVRDLFRAQGLWAEAVDAGDLAWRDGRLWHGEVAIDLVYNRLCDFYFEQPEHAALRDAYLAEAAVVTPHPRAHALYADKRALILLSDQSQLAAWGVDAAARAVLAAGIPETVAVTAARAEALWAERGRLFFKPATGYGSKAAYRGDKLTRRVWQEILAGRYVAQRLAPPSERRLSLPDGGPPMKVDLRNYVYDGGIQFLSARLYRGQTTNFQTPGGGLAAVFLLDGGTTAPTQGGEGSGLLV